MGTKSSPTKKPPLSIPLAWPFLDSVVIRGEHDQMFLERLFDLCETALGGGNRDALTKRLREFMTREPHDPGVSTQALEQFFATLMWKAVPTDQLDFPEQPFLFYPVGKTVLLWDYLRQGGVLRAMARALARRSGAVRSRKGEAFERDVAATLRGVGTVKNLRTDLKVRASELEAQFDLAFECCDVVCVIEAKSYFRNSKYYMADPVRISERVTLLEKTLNRLDEKLETFHRGLRLYWPGDHLRARSGLVCLEDTEFVASADPRWWLTIGETPRICTLRELLAFVSSPEIAQLSAHPSLVRF